MLGVLTVLPTGLFTIGAVGRVVCAKFAVTTLAANPFIRQSLAVTALDVDVANLSGVAHGWSKIE